MGFFDIITRVNETLDEKAHLESLGSGIKRVGIYSALLGVLLGLIFGIIMALQGNILNAILGAIASIFGVIILFVVGSLFYCACLWLPAKLLGGKGSFGNQYGAMTLGIWQVTALMVILIAVYFAAIVLLFIPIIGWIIDIVLFAGLAGLYLFVYIYSIYFSVAFMQKVHDLSNFRAMVALSIGMAILSVVLFAVYFGVIFLVLGAAIFNPSAIQNTGFLPLSQ